MAQEIGQLRAALSANAARFEQDMNRAKDAVRKNARKMETSMGGVKRAFNGAIKVVKALAVAAAAATVAAGYAAQRVIKDAIKAASDLEEVQNKFNVVFKDQIETATAWAENLRKSYIMSEREAKQYLSSIQDLLVPMGMASSKAGELSFEIVKLAADLASFNNMPTAQVMENIQSALTGEYESMKKYGVILNATTVQERALAMGLAKTKDELTAGHKALAAYKIMLENSAAAIGDVERSSGSYANQLKKLHANIEDLHTILGKELLPMATDIIEKMNEWIATNDELIRQRMPEYIRAMGKALQFVGESLNWWISPSARKENALVRQISDLEEELKRLESWKPNFINKFFGQEKDVARIGEVRRQITQLKGELEELWISQGKITKAGGVPKDIVSPETTEGIKKQGEEIKKLSKEAEKARKAIEKEIEMLQFRAETYGMTADKVTLYRLELAGANAEQLRAARLALEDIAAKTAQAEATQKAADALKALGDRGQQLWEQTRTPLERYNAALVELDRLLIAGAIDMDVYTRAMGKAWEDLQRAAEDTKDTAKETTDYIAELNKQTYTNMQQGLSDVLFSTMKGDFDSFGDWFESFMDTIYRSWTDTLAKMAMQKLMGENLQGGGWLDKLLGGGSGGGSGGGWLGSIVGLIGSLFHEGGKVGVDRAPGRLVSPEVFAHAPRLHEGLMPDEYPAILQKGETVLSKNESMTARGPNIVMNITTPDAGSFRASQGQIMRDAGLALRRWGARNG